jgi:hypothetical protein
LENESIIKKESVRVKGLPRQLETMTLVLQAAIEKRIEKEIEE